MSTCNRHLLWDWRTRYIQGGSVNRIFCADCKQFLFQLTFIDGKSKLRFLKDTPIEFITYAIQKCLHNDSNGEVDTETEEREAICIYHIQDLDGKCSAAIVKRSIGKDVTFMPYNYHYANPDIKTFIGKEVVIVDFSFSREFMLELFKVAKRVIWIDHHQTAIRRFTREELDSYKNLEYRLDPACAATELTWIYFNPNKAVPSSVKMISDYDIWNHHDDVVKFQYGLRSCGDCLPDDEVWNTLLRTDLRIYETYIDTIVARGEAILLYLEIANAEYLKSYGFETVFMGHKCLACNVGMQNSSFFDSLEVKPDILLLFCGHPGKWKISIYSATVDVSRLAETFGGGGHKGAAGFSSANFDFLSTEVDRA